MTLRILSTAFLLTALAGQAAVAGSVERSETIERRLRFSSSAEERLVVVDNVFGSVEVTGNDGDEVLLIAHKTIEARSEEKADLAEAEVTLDITAKDDLIEFYVDGPFRDHRRGCFNWEGPERHGYKVRYDFVLAVPRSCAIELQTVNEGDILVRSFSGEYRVGNVNGRIAMEAIRGSGDLYAVNGEVTVEFDENPHDDCSVGTVNGDVRLYFQPELSADFYMKSMNGRAFTDFAVAALPSRSRISKEMDGKDVYRIDRKTGIRAGRGGPRVDLDTLNGDMFILSR